MKSVRPEEANWSEQFEREEWEQLQAEIAELDDRLLHDREADWTQGTLGWLTPLDPDSEVVRRVVRTAATIREQSDVLVVIGVGGSYLGARAGIEMLRTDLCASRRNGPDVMFIRHHLSSGEYRHLFDSLEGNRVSVDVVSKSVQRLLRGGSALAQKHKAKSNHRHRSGLRPSGTEPKMEIGFTVKGDTLNDG